MTTVMRGSDNFDTAKNGRVLQIVNVQNGAIVTGTTTIDYDDGIPQNTEGDEYMTLAITPSNTNNLLKIEVTTMASNSSVNHMITLLFQDTTTSALAAITAYQGVATGSVAVSFTHYMTAGTTSATTFKVRVGGEGAGTTSFNGQNTARRFGGTMASSITITEVAA